MSFRALLATAILMTLAACNPPEPHQTSTQSDATILHGGVVWSGAEQKPRENEAIVVRHGRIEFVGSLADAEAKAPGARRIDTTGMTVLPGLVDAHAHIDSLGRKLDIVDLNGAATSDEVAQRVARRATTTPAGSWIEGRGWDQNDWPVKEFPTAEVLDKAVPGHPVYLTRIDGHAAWINSAALKAANIDASTKDPEGGRFLRDHAGKPTGVLIDNAMNLMGNVMPAPSRELRKARLRKALEDIAAHGLTAVHEAGSDSPAEVIAIYKELIDEGTMPVRVYYMLPLDDALLAEWFEKGPLIDYGHKLTVRSVKLYADGALGSRGAALLAPYSDEATARGLLLITPDKAVDVLRKAVAAGFQVGTHAIGDRGTRLVIEAYEKAGVKPEDRFRIEHFQVAALDDIPRAAKLGVIASMQPTHATSDMPWAETRLGPLRIKGAYAWRKILSSGMRLALGSDFPVEDVNPFYGIYSAVTRQDHDGHPPGGWIPEEKLTLAEAVRGFTLDAAYAAFEEETRGTIEAGKWADFTIVDGDFATMPAADLWKAKVRYTIVNGVVVFKSGR